MAPNKQKILCDGLGLLRDAQTVAHYNLTNGTQVTVKPKERGRKGQW
jgi:hypothetical protein